MPHGGKNQNRNLVIFALFDNLTSCHRPHPPMDNTSMQWAESQELSVCTPTGYTVTFATLRCQSLSLDAARKQPPKALCLTGSSRLCYRGRRVCRVDQCFVSICQSVSLLPWRPFALHYQAVYPAFALGRSYDCPHLKCGYL